MSIRIRIIKRRTQLSARAAVRQAAPSFSQRDGAFFAADLNSTT
jgi:hypothetical protein